MENDPRDRRDPLEPDSADAPAPDEDAARGADRRAVDEPATEAADDAAVSPADIESWPSQDAVAAHPTEPPVAGAADVEAWPTEPPAAGSASSGTWPTEPPEQGEEPILEPAAAEPPPADVEAYGASPAWSDEGANQSGTAPETADEPAVPGGATAESTQCPRCGTENQAGLSFCRNCGQRLIAAGAAATVERPSTPEGTMACPRCGTHNRAGVAFCQNCGANLRGTSAGYVPPSVAGEPGRAPVAAERGGAILGPIVLLIGIVGLVTAYLLPFAYGTGSLLDRALGADGYGVAFWPAYPDSGLADQAYFGLAAASPILAVLLLLLAAGGFVRARPGAVQMAGLVVALLWSVGLVVLFALVELVGNWDGDIVGLLRELTPAGIIFMLTALIVVIGTLTRLGRS
jgi:hypothetical protein